MTGISEADMNRINEFLERNKFERSPELLCPDDDDEDAAEETPWRETTDGRAGSTPRE